jgi:hypothetical protein
MPKHDGELNRHLLCVWVRWAIESKLVDKLPAQYGAGGPRNSESTVGYASHLLAELRDPASSERPLSQILADAQRFREWADSQQTISPRIGLDEIDLEPQPRERAPGAQRGSKTKSDPMWDDLLDG